MSDKQIVFKCMDCGKINIFPGHKQDGNKCVDCNGLINPIGELADKCDRVMIFIKEEKLLTKDAAEDRMKRFYNNISNKIIPVDTSQKILFVDRFTGETITEI